MRASIRKSKMTHKWLQSATDAVANTCECVTLSNARAIFIDESLFFPCTRVLRRASTKRYISCLCRFTMPLRFEMSRAAPHCICFVVIVPSGCALSSECAPNKRKMAFSAHSQHTQYSNVIFFSHSAICLHLFIRWVVACRRFILLWRFFAFVEVVPRTAICPPAPPHPPFLQLTKYKPNSKMENNASLTFVFIITQNYYDFSVETSRQMMWRKSFAWKNSHSSKEQSAKEEADEADEQKTKHRKVNNPSNGIERPHGDWERKSCIERCPILRNWKWFLRIRHHNDIMTGIVYRMFAFV